jgi:putative glycosyl hydrolase-like family 15 (GHL15) protein
VKWTVRPGEPIDAPRRMKRGRDPRPGRLALVGALVAISVLSGAARSAPSAERAERQGQQRETSTRMLAATGVFRLGDSYRTASSYGRYPYVFVSRHFARTAARLPGTSLVYMSGTSIQRSWSTGVSYADADANGWLLRSSDGAHIAGLNGSLIADIGDRGYQDRFLTNVSTFLRRTGSEGVFIDDVLGDPAIQTNGVYPSKYPTPEAWERAMSSFVSRVGAGLKARGHYVVVNMAKFLSGDGRSDDGTFARQFAESLAPSVSGIAVEFWLQNPLDLGTRAIGSRWNEFWTGWQSIVSVAQGSGVDFFGIMYGSSRDVRAMRFGRGSFLLDWDGRGGAFAFHVTDRSDPYHEAWVRQLGLPLERKRARAPGVWQRQFERGLVIVNAKSRSVNLRVNGIRRTIAGTDALFVRLSRR